MVKKQENPIDVLIVAAGNSSRLPGDVPKTYRALGGKAVLRHSVETFLSHPKIRSVRVVINDDHRAFYDAAIDGLDLPDPVIGGAERQISVSNGLEVLRGDAPTHVLIHDAARPGVDAALIDRVVDALQTNQAVIPTLPMKDTVKQVSGEIITNTLPREQLVAVQTPQGFYYDMIATAHERIADVSATDDAALAEALGVEVVTVMGSEQNHKLTTIADWNVMQKVETRVGQGFDVHRFCPPPNLPPLMGGGSESSCGSQEGGIILCGIFIPFHLCLDGHSDADVALHALVDAMLGAMAEGDIGQHFPPSDDKWKGVSSSKFVQHALKMLRNKNAELVHVDLTIICEKPKIAPYRDAMRKQVAELLKLDISRISVKATTTEKLGFTGRGEGIAAQAVVTIMLPSPCGLTTGYQAESRNVGVKHQHDG